MSRRSDSGLDGILLIDKPSGWTSHDVVAKVRRLTGQRRIGHTGTLDPAATGLLVLCLGTGTRMVEYLVGHTKRYTGTIKLGLTTTTDDAEGEPLAERPVPPLDPETLGHALAPFRGTISQRPPAYSALKLGGRRAYDMARQGEAPELAPRPVTIHAFEARPATAATIEIDVTCSAGTYIRSLARDLGETLGCGAHLAALRREQSGPFHVAHAYTLEELETLIAAGQLADILLPVDEGLGELDAAILGPDGTRAVANGAPWQTREWVRVPPGAIRIYGSMGSFVGVGNLLDSGEIRARKVILREKSPK